MQIRWKNGSHVKGDPNLAFDLIKEHSAKYGGFTQEARRDMFLSQKPKDAPFHDVYEWNKTKAWEAYNIERSGYIARSIEVFEVDKANPDREIVMRAFVSCDETDDSTSAVRHLYRDAVEMMQSPEGRAILLASARRDIDVFKRKYAHLSEMARIIDEMDDFLDEAG
jgi:hypothetical protein